jgi:transposase InsO family protein
MSLRIPACEASECCGPAKSALRSSVSAASQNEHGREAVSIGGGSRRDQGSQFISLAFGQLARAAGIAQSMGSRGDCSDNAVAESLFATVKKELVHRRIWPTKAELRFEGFDYIEVFCKRQRRHSTLGSARQLTSRPRRSAPPDRSSPLRGSHHHHDSQKMSLHPQQRLARMSPRVH